MLFDEGDVQSPSNKSLVRVRVVVVKYFSMLTRRSGGESFACAVCFSRRRCVCASAGPERGPLGADRPQLGGQSRRTPAGRAPQRQLRGSPDLRPLASEPRGAPADLRARGLHEHIVQCTVHCISAAAAAAVADAFHCT